MSGPLTAVFVSFLVFTAHAASVHAQEAPALYRLEPSGSQLYVVAHRAGLLSFLGHDHAIVPTQWSGTICWSPSEPEHARGTVTIDAAGLVIDGEEGRAMAGLGRAPSADDITEIQQKLLAEQNLHAEAYPELRLEITGANDAGPEQLELDGLLTIRDVTQEVSFPAEIVPAGDGDLRAHGRLTVRQTDFGIRPESVAGVVRVADRVDIHFDLIATPTGQPCG